MLHEEVEETEGRDEGADDAVGGRQRKDQQHPARDFKRDLKWWHNKQKQLTDPTRNIQQNAEEQFIKLNLWPRDTQKPCPFRKGHT